MSARFDLAVIGGGIMGCATALRARAGGMRVVVLDRSELGSGASGVNAGTLSLQIKRVKLMPYALRGRALWEKAGARVGFQRTGGFTLAFTEQEAALLEERMALKRAAGAPIEMISANRVADLEPGLSRRIVAASHCALDGHADSSLTGAHYRGLLQANDIALREHAPVMSIAREDACFVLIAGGERVCARRILLACGGWLEHVAAMIGVVLPVRVRVNTVSVTERAPPLIAAVIGHATGLLTLKQKSNGTVLIGGGWQGTGTPEAGRGDVALDTLLTNLRLAQFALPGLRDIRLMRSWTGFESNVPDFYPLAGQAPGVPDAFILGCVRGGYTIGPFIGELMGDLILGREPALPLFDPGRFTAPPLPITQGISP